jgi:hypothetical protein
MAARVVGAAGTLGAHSAAKGWWHIVAGAWVRHLRVAAGNQWLRDDAIAVCVWWLGNAWLHACHSRGEGQQRHEAHGQFTLCVWLACPASWVVTRPGQMQYVSVTQ